MWPAILTVALKIIGLVLDKVGADNETKAHFLAFISKLEERQLASARLRDDYRAQLERLKGEQNGDKRQ